MVENMRILLGYDGSACADSAVYDLRKAGLPEHVEAVVLTATDLTPHLPPSCFMPVDEAAQAGESQIVHNARLLARRAMDEARTTASRGADRVRAEFPAWQVQTETGLDCPAYRALIVKAERWRPDLIVVGSHGRSAAGRALLGSVSTQVLSHAHCSVRLARFREDAGRLAGEPVRLVLGIDGSHDSAAAASAVAERSWPRGSSVRVVMAVDDSILITLAYGPLQPGWAVGVKPEWDSQTRARHVVNAVAKELNFAGLSATPVVAEGDPKKVLLQEAEEFGADCIFLGAKGHGGFDRFLLGSVSTAVATRARCSVEVVRQG